VISVHMLCLDDCFATTTMPQPTEITQFIFGQPLSLFGGFGPEVSRLCLCDSLPARSVRSQFRRDRRCYTEGAPLR
jgi:hypothetical protein